MRISDWSSDVCSSDLAIGAALIDRVAGNALLEHGFALCGIRAGEQRGDGGTRFCALSAFRLNAFDRVAHFLRAFLMENLSADDARAQSDDAREQDPASNGIGTIVRSEEHTSELQSLMRISYAVFCLKKK